MENTSLYKYYDDAGILIYIGITSRGIARNIEHNTSKDWWPYVSTQEVEHFPDRPTALKRERELIHLLRPPFNKEHNPDHQELVDEYLETRRSMEQVRTAIQYNTKKKWQPLVALPVRSPHFVELAAHQSVVPKDLDLESNLKLIVSSNGRKAKLLNAYWAGASLRLTIKTHDPERCIGGRILFRMPHHNIKHSSIKQIDLLHK